MTKILLEAKNEEVLRNAIEISWHPILMDLYLWELSRFGEAQLMITCAYEHRNYPSVHDVIPLRGYDLRSWLFKHPEEVANDINSHWIYDSKTDNPDRVKFKVVRLHARCPKCGFDTEPPLRENCGECDTNIEGHWHFHNQVHDNTVMIKQATKGEES